MALHLRYNGVLLDYVVCKDVDFLATEECYIAKGLTIYGLARGVKFWEGKSHSHNGVIVVDFSDTLVWGLGLVRMDLALPHLTLL